MNMNTTVTQPAHPASQPAQPASQPVASSFSTALAFSSKTVEKSLAFAIGLHEEIDASRFSGPEQFSAGAPLISPDCIQLFHSKFPICSSMCCTITLPISQCLQAVTYHSSVPRILVSFTIFYIFSLFSSSSLLFFSFSFLLGTSLKAR